MSNELDIHGGNELQPYSPGGVDLYQTDAESHWGELSPDYLNTPGQQVANINDPQVQANINALAAHFEHDFQSWGFVQRDIDLCVQWFKQSLANPITSMPPRRNSYNLWQLNNDPTMVAFANFAATHKFSQQLMQSVCWWVKQVEDAQRGAGRFAGQQVQGPTSADPLDQLSDSDYERVVQINSAAAARTDGILRDKFGDGYHGAMKVIRNYWDKLSTAEQQHLEQLTAGWVKGTNTPEVLIGLYNQAIGAGSIPKDSVAIAREIASYENLMKTDRKLWMKSDDLQARYRHLLTIRDGGR